MGYDALDFHTITIVRIMAAGVCDIDLVHVNMKRNEIQNMIHAILRR